MFQDLACLECPSLPKLEEKYLEGPVSEEAVVWGMAGLGLALNIFGCSFSHGFLVLSDLEAIVGL